VTKHDVRIIWLSMSVYELFEWPSYSGYMPSLIHLERPRRKSNLRRKPNVLYCYASKSSVRQRRSGT